MKEVQCLTRNCIVAVSEGVRLANGSFAAENFQSGVVDAFGHRYLSGVGKYLEALVREKIGCKVRSIELNVLQRCSSHLMSATDVREARKIGSYAIRFALQGHTGVMMVLEEFPTARTWFGSVANRFQKLPTGNSWSPALGSTNVETASPTKCLNICCH